VQAAGLTVRRSAIYCSPEPRPTKLRFWARECHVIGTSGGKDEVGAFVLSLVRSGPGFVSATTHALPASTYSLPHPTPLILELVNFGTS